MRALAIGLSFLCVIWRIQNSFYELNLGVTFLYKVNIIERYKGKMNYKPQLTHVIFKVRTLDDNLLQTIDGHLRVKVKGDELEAYKKKTAVFVLYKNRRLHTKENEYDYMHFVLSIILANYQLK